MLTSDDVIRIAHELETGKPPSNTSDEANAVRERLRTQITAIKAKGWAVGLPLYDDPQPTQGEKQ